MEKRHNLQISIQLDMREYVFRKYIPEYRAFYASEKKKIIKALGPTTKIEHVGSTAVPDLGGKGILDIVVGIPKSKKRR